MEQLRAGGFSGIYRSSVSGFPRSLTTRADAVLPEPADFDDLVSCCGRSGRNQESRSGSGLCWRSPVPKAHRSSTILVVDLEREPFSNRWSATLTSATLAKPGVYHILYTAFRDDGFGIDLSGAPLGRQVTVADAAACVREPEASPRHRRRIPMRAIPFRVKR